MNKLLNFAFKYSKLMSTEREVIEFLYKQKNHIFEGGYSDFVRAMGLPTYQNVSNYRKVILNLQQKNIITITCSENSTRKVSVIGLTTNWQNNV